MKPPTPRPKSKLPPKPQARLVKKHDNKHQHPVSIWFWLLSMLVMAIPLLNVIMVLVWAFSGDNESRKNFFKAVIVMFCLSAGLAVLFYSLGILPFFLK